MVLRDNLFYIKSIATTDKGVLFLLDLNPEHFIYQAHFPGRPITPGVCIVQIVKELLEIQLKQCLEIKKVKNVKFLSVISPDENLHVSCELTNIQVDPEQQLVKVQAVVTSEVEVYAKVSIICGLL